MRGRGSSPVRTDGMNEKGADRRVVDRPLLVPGEICYPTVAVFQGSDIGSPSLIRSITERR